MNPEYEKYGSLDFAQDDQFIRWVKNKDPDAAERWHSWLELHPEKKGEVEEARRLVTAIKIREEEPPAAKLQALWDKIETEVATPTVAKRRKLVPLRWVGYAAAACAAIILIVLNLRFNEVISTPIDNYSTASLPDNSEVEINPASTIEFNKKRWSDNREVALEGEAFFDVEKGEKFTVVTSLGKVEVLGTEFNVRARGGEFEVDCFEGRVKVALENGDVDTLEAGFGTKIDNSGRLMAPYPLISEKAGLQSGNFYFSGSSVEKTLSVIERQYDIEIESPASMNQDTINFFFSKGALDTTLYNFSYTIPDYEVIKLGDKQYRLVPESE